MYRYDIQQRHDDDDGWFTEAGVVVVLVDNVCVCSVMSM